MAGLLNLNTNNKLTCDDGSSSFSGFIFDGVNGNPTMSIVKGAATLLNISLLDVAIPMTEYVTQKFTLKADTSILIAAPNIMSTLGEVQFIALLVEYPKADTGGTTIVTNEKFIKYEYPTGATQLNIGKIMILSGTTKDGSGWDLDSSPGGLTLVNPHSLFDVTVTILAFN